MLVAGCAAVAGVSDFAVDPCFDGCPDGSSLEVSTKDGGADGTPGPPDGSTGDADAALEASIDAAPPPSPGKSFVRLSGTGVAVGKVAILTLTTKDDVDAPIARPGAKISFTTTGGTSAVTF